MRACAWIALVLWLLGAVFPFAIGRVIPFITATDPFLGRILNEIVHFVLYRLPVVLLAVAVLIAARKLEAKSSHS
jgi:hypothetical protein